MCILMNLQKLYKSASWLSFLFLQVVVDFLKCDNYHFLPFLLEFNTYICIQIQDQAFSPGLEIYSHGLLWFAAWHDAMHF